mmetsp:Transcript_22879/g.60765  ORF Transcript_22879/g.60765 Transcript_22879/m.60765 type:complete len:246 (+) Transcript_22879:410-1147(+)
MLIVAVSFSSSARRNAQDSRSIAVRDRSLRVLHAANTLTLRSSISSCNGLSGAAGAAGSCELGPAPDFAPPFFVSSDSDLDERSLGLELSDGSASTSGATSLMIRLPCTAATFLSLRTGVFFVCNDTIPAGDRAFSGAGVAFSSSITAALVNSGTAPGGIGGIWIRDDRLTNAVPMICGIGRIGRSGWRGGEKSGGSGWYSPGGCWRGSSDGDDKKRRDGGGGGFDVEAAMAMARLSRNFLKKGG